MVFFSPGSQHADFFSLGKTLKKVRRYPGESPFTSQATREAEAGKYGWVLQSALDF
jgi:hypothetical protein